jgi:thiamine kinase-like enzyme
MDRKKILEGILKEMHETYEDMKAENRFSGKTIQYAQRLYVMNEIFREKYDTDYTTLYYQRKRLTSRTTKPPVVVEMEPED